MNKILITGISGFLGHYLAKNKPGQFDIVGVYNKNHPPKSVRGISCNLVDENEVLQVLEQIQPHGIIHTAAVSDPAFCEQNPEHSEKVNIHATALLAKYAAENNIPFVFTSTDLVFDGKKGNYKETDQANPLNIYGQQKLIAEQEIARIYPEAAICRMPLMLGNAEGFPEKYLQKLLKQAADHQDIPLFTDEFRSPLGGNSAAKGLWLALEKMSGLYHLGGAERLSRWQLGEVIAEKFGLDKKLLKPMKQSDLNLKNNPSGRCFDRQFQGS